MIGIIDYGLGNVRAISNLLNVAEVDNCIVNDIEISANKFRGVVLPGVGSFDVAMNCLEKTSFDKWLEVAREQTYIIGICLGMQVLFNDSEEGLKKGLGFLSGTIKKLEREDQIGIPNCGWREIDYVKKHQDIFSPEKAYFNHSFAFRNPVDDKARGVLKNNREIVVSVEEGNLFGFQYHPERSHNHGINLFKSFQDKFLK